MKVNVQIVKLIPVLLLVGCAVKPTNDKLDFDPVVEGAIILFGKACIEFYPKNDGSLELWLDRPGIKKLDRSERSRLSTQSSEEYLINSATVYSLVYEKINLCTVNVSGIDKYSMDIHLEQFRNGFVSSGLIEDITIGESRVRTHEIYKYTKNGKFVMRIDYSYMKDKSVSLSAVSGMRSDNL